MKDKGKRIVAIIAAIILVGVPIISPASVYAHTQEEEQEQLSADNTETIASVSVTNEDMQSVEGSQIDPAEGPQPAEVRYKVSLKAPSAAGGTITTWEGDGQKRNSTYGVEEEVAEGTLYFVEVTASENYEVESVKDQSGNVIIAVSVKGKVYTYQIEVTENKQLTVNYKEIEVKGENKEPNSASDSALTLEVEDYEGTYDGEKHTVKINALTSSDNTDVAVQYSMNGIDWEERAENFTFVDVPANENYTTTFYVRPYAVGYPEEPERQVSVTIKPAIVEVTPESLVVAFTDENKNETLTQMNSIQSVSIKNAEGEPHKTKYDDVLSYSGYFAKETGDSVGKYKIIQGTFALNNASADFNANNYRLVVKEDSTVTITGELHLSLDGYSGTYDSLKHGITVTEGRADDPDQAVSIEYSLDKDANTWEAEPIELKDVTDGPATVYARITAPNNPNYTPVIKPAVINISKKEIMIKADDKNVVYGKEIPELTASIDENGLAKEDRTSDVLTNEGGLAAGTYTTKAAAGSPIGKYTITAAAGGLKSKNYDLKFQDGLLSITQADDLLLTVENRTFTYDGKAHTLEVIHDDGDNTTVEYSLGNGASWSTEVPYFTDAGTYEVLVKASSPNYSNTPGVKRTITIKPKDVTILVANAAKAFGTDDPIFTGEVTGLVNADDLGNVVYGRADEDAAKENVGDDITITASYTANKNYAVQVMPAKLTISEDGHTFGGEWKYDATHHWQLCSRGDGEIGNKGAHTAGRWIVDKEPTIQEVGEQHKECTVCGYIMSMKSIVKAEGKKEVKPEADRFFTFYGKFKELQVLRLNGVEMGILPLSETLANLTYPDYKGIAGVIKAGSVEVTLYADFLKSLANGTYVLEAEFMSGDKSFVGSTEFTVVNDDKSASEPEGNKPEEKRPEGTKPEETKPEGTKPEGTKPEETHLADKSSAPKTGDENNLCMWLVMLLAGGALLVCRKKKREVE